MTVQKNVPDRIKLIIQFVVFTLATCFVLFLIFVVILANWVNNLHDYRMLILIGIPASSLFIQGAIVIYRWGKLIQQENAGELPSMQDMRNITPRQMIYLAIGLPLLLASVVAFQLFSKLAGVICFIFFLVIWGIDTLYVRERINKINEYKNSK